MSDDVSDVHGHFGSPEGYDHHDDLMEDASSVGNDDSCEPYDPNCGGGFV